MLHGVNSSNIIKKMWMCFGYVFIFRHKTAMRHKEDYWMLSTNHFRWLEHSFFRFSTNLICNQWIIFFQIRFEYSAFFENLITYWNSKFLRLTYFWYLLVISFYLLMIVHFIAYCSVINKKITVWLKLRQCQLTKTLIKEKGK